MDRVIAIIVAAGKGLRMNSPVRKQFHVLAGQPIIVHTLRRFDTCDLLDHIIIVLPEDDIEFCRDQFIKPLQYNKKITLVAGGKRRQDSVYNGLQAIDEDKGVVVVHDGVRPFVSHEKITACIAGARKCGACILGIPAYDTLKRISADRFVLETLDRARIWLAQTPQAFRTELLKKAHELAKKNGFSGTDDASIVEQLDIEVKIIQGSRNNIKITNQQDIKLASRLMEFASCPG